MLEDANYIIDESVRLVLLFSTGPILRTLDSSLAETVLLCYLFVFCSCECEFLYGEVNPSHYIVYHTLILSQISYTYLLSLSGQICCKWAHELDRPSAGDLNSPWQAGITGSSSRIAEYGHKKRIVKLDFPSNWNSEETQMKPKLRMKGMYMVCNRRDTMRRTVFIVFLFNLCVISTCFNVLNVCVYISSMLANWLARVYYKEWICNHRM